MKHRSGDRPRGVDGDSPLADRISAPRGPEMGHPEGRSGVAGLGRESLTMAGQGGLLAGVARPGGWRPIQSP
jgi:hypothetical protein